MSAWRNEMLGAVEHPVSAVLLCARLHAAQIGARTGFGHGQAIPFLAGHARLEITGALLGRARTENIGRARHAGPVQRVIGAAEFLFVEQPGRRIEAGAAKFFGNVGGVETGCDRFGLDLSDQVHVEMAGALDHSLMRIELVLDEGARGLDDHLLFLGQSEVHCLTPLDLGFQYGHRPGSPGRKPAARRRRPETPPCWQCPGR
jgi:hypothetical protein